ncbi:unnamed protein product [Adineta steineri]|uniref:Uncharacterized protein n=1 Tax=Adineta steineri TaxID=433720 RepID=A0A815R517_9BILA|nr:unnamed protein product [Adineta steineri]CAF4075988.1 unnamed protein product [Adineta steineri]
MCSIRINKNLSQTEKDNSFITRAALLSSEINVHTLTFIILLVRKGTLRSYALNCCLFSNQPCESTFRTGRSLSGSLSTIITFSIYEFINKVAKISQLNQIKSTEESNNNKSSLKFPRHQKYRSDESNTSASTQDISTVTIQDIENIIIKAYEKAESIMNNFQLIEVLNQSNLNDIYKLSSFALHELNKRSTVDHSVSNNYDAYDAIDQSHDIDLVECSEDSSDEQEEEVCNLETTKQTFHGMKICEKINSIKVNNYFKILINGKHYYMLKQTAARRLTINKNHLSFDRHFRVKETSKQR